LGGTATALAGWAVYRSAERTKLRALLSGHPGWRNKIAAQRDRAVRLSLPIIGTRTANEAFVELTGAPPSTLDVVSAVVPGVADVRETANTATSLAHRAASSTVSILYSATPSGMYHRFFGSDSDMGGDDMGFAPAVGAVAMALPVVTLLAGGLMYQRSRSIWKTLGIMLLPMGAPVYVVYRGAQHFEVV